MIALTFVLVLGGIGIGAFALNAKKDYTFAALELLAAACIIGGFVIAIRSAP